MKLPTRRFAQLLRDVKGWEEKYPVLCHAQVEYLLTEFCFADHQCVHCNQWDPQAWAIPHVYLGHLFTRCD